MQAANPQRGHRVLQTTINLILKWLSNHGFRISPLKTSMLIFEKRKSKTPFPSLLLDNHPIPISETVKVLGLRFHTRHSWLPHIKELKAKCIRASNILKYLAHPSTGCNRKTLLPLYQSLIRSILDYGAPVYGLAPPSQLAILDSIQNSAIRLCTGAFPTSPAFRLCADADSPRSITVVSHSQPAFYPLSHSFLPHQSMTVYSSNPAISLNRTELILTYCLTLITHFLTTSNSTASYPSTRVRPRGQSPFQR